MEYVQLHISKSGFSPRKNSVYGVRKSHSDAAGFSIAHFGKLETQPAYAEMQFALAETQPATLHTQPA